MSGVLREGISKEIRLHLQPYVLRKHAGTSANSYRYKYMSGRRRGTWKGVLRQKNEKHLVLHLVPVSSLLPHSLCPTEGRPGQKSPQRTRIGYLTAM